MKLYKRLKDRYKQRTTTKTPQREDCQHCDGDDDESGSQFDDLNENNGTICKENCTDGKTIGLATTPVLPPEFRLSLAFLDDNDGGGYGAAHQLSLRNNVPTFKPHAELDTGSPSHVTWPSKDYNCPYNTGYSQNLRYKSAGSNEVSGNIRLPRQPAQVVESSFRPGTPRRKPTTLAVPGPPHEHNAPGDGGEEHTGTSNMRQRANHQAKQDLQYCPSTIMNVDIYDSDSQDSKICPPTDACPSSVAATMDEFTQNDNDTPSFSRPESVSMQSVERASTLLSVRKFRSVSDLPTEPSLNDSAISGIGKTRRLSEPLLSEFDDHRFEKKGRHKADYPSQSTNQAMKYEPVLCPRTANEQQDTRIKTPDKGSGLLTLASLKKERSPTAIVTKFRTREWAKYLCEAQPPVMKKLGLSKDGLISGCEEEAPAPVRVHELQSVGPDPLQEAKFASQLTPNQAALNNMKLHCHPNWRLSRSISSQLPLAQRELEFIPPRPLLNPGQHPSHGRSISHPSLGRRREAEGLERNVSTARFQVMSGFDIQEPTDQTILWPGVSRQVQMTAEQCNPANRELVNYGLPHPPYTTTNYVPSLCGSNVDHLVMPPGRELSYSSKEHDDNVSLSFLRHTLRSHSNNRMISRRQSFLSGSQLQRHHHHGQFEPINSQRRHTSPASPLLTNHPSTEMQTDSDLHGHTRPLHRLAIEPSQAKAPSVRSPSNIQYSLMDSSPAGYISSRDAMYNSHQPKRGIEVDYRARQARTARFQQNLRQDLGPEACAARMQYADESHRVAMMDEKRQLESQVRYQRMEKSLVDSAIDEGMRNGKMRRLHRETLKRMQSMALEHPRD